MVFFQYVFSICNGLNECCHIYDVVHDHVETVFGLCKQLTGYDEVFFYNTSGAVSSCPGSTQISVMLAV